MLMPRQVGKPEVFLGNPGPPGACARRRPARAALTVLTARTLTMLHAAGWFGAGASCATSAGPGSIGFSSVPHRAPDDIELQEGNNGVLDDDRLPDAPWASRQWPLASQVGRWREVAAFVSIGHLPVADRRRPTRTVVYPEDAAQAYLSRREDRVYQPGAMVAQLVLEQNGAPDQWEVAYVMRRTRSGWDYFIAAPTGETMASAATTSACASCHQRSRRAVFGAPVPGETDQELQLSPAPRTQREAK